MHRNLAFTPKNMAYISLFTALLCVLSPFAVTLPISPVPFTLGTFVLYITIYIIGLKRGLISFLLYLFLGFVGLPVFAGFTSGPARLLGPTGGYLFGELFLVLVLGLLIKRSYLLGLILGTIICYLFGTLWLAGLNQISYISALSLGVLPYLLFDAIKILGAFLLAPRIRSRLIKAKLLSL